WIARSLTITMSRRVGSDARREKFAQVVYPMNAASIPSPPGLRRLAGHATRTSMMNRLLKSFARMYFRHFPVERGKWRVWTQLMPGIAGDGAEVECRLQNGIRVRLNPQDAIQRFAYYWGCWSPNESWLVRRLLRPGDTFIDAGANFGYFTLLGSHLVGPTG